MAVMNFQLRVRLLRSTLQVLFVGLLLVSAGLLLWALTQTVSLGAQKQSLADAVAQQQAKMAEGVIPVDTLLTMSQQAAALNQTVTQKGEPVLALLDQVSDALLVNVRLDRFEYNAGEGAATLEAVSPSTVDLADFVGNLEAAPSIDQVVVARQEKDDTVEALNRYEIFLTAEAH